MAPSLGRTDMNASYEVVATRSGDWWTVEVTSGLPANVVGVSQARRLTEVPTVARNLFGDLLDIAPATIDVRVPSTPAATCRIARPRRRDRPQHRHG